MTDLINYLNAQRFQLLKKYENLNYCFLTISDIQNMFSYKDEVSYTWIFTKKQANGINQTKSKYYALLDMVTTLEEIQIEYRKLCESLQKEITELKAKDTP